MKTVDIISSAIVMVLLILVSYWLGYSYSEKKQCEARGGQYSRDFNLCFNKEVLK